MSRQGDATLCGGCGEPIHKGTTGAWLDGRSFQWCDAVTGSRHFPARQTTAWAKTTPKEEESWV
jgi:hypothetical protein